MHSLRYIKIGMVASIALFFSIVTLDNILDFDTNWQFVQHVMSMDTTFQKPSVMWRAITNPQIQICIYYMIIAWQALTSVICWLGCAVLLNKINEPTIGFNRAKKFAYWGLFFGFILYMVGFVIVGGEWFSSWQSQQWNGQMKAGLFISLIMFVMIFIAVD